MGKFGGDGLDVLEIPTVVGFGAEAFANIEQTGPCWYTFSHFALLSFSCTKNYRCGGGAKVQTGTASIPVSRWIESSVSSAKNGRGRELSTNPSHGPTPPPMTMRNPNQRLTLKAQAPLLRPQKVAETTRRGIAATSFHHSRYRCFPSSIAPCP